MRTIILALLVAACGFADDWRMGGRTQDRNPVSPEKNAPTDWQVASDGKAARNVRWSARVGDRALGGPVVANGLVWVGTNNGRPLDPAVKGDRGVLACFRESDGKFLYQYTSPRLYPDKFIADWPSSGSSGSPVTAGDRLWFITNRREVVCLDTRPLSRGEGPAKELWKYDLVKALGVVPNAPMIAGQNDLGSPAVYKDLLFVPTGNSVDVDHPGAIPVRNAEAPAFVCLRKETGELVWKDNSPGKGGYMGHHASALIIEVAGKAQVIQPQGDGWVRAFDALTGKLLWKFDTNRKGAEWRWNVNGTHAKHVVIATPVYADGRVYFAAGREPEACSGPGRLFCIDPAKAGDVSPEIDDGKGGGKPNPNSALLWDFTKAGEQESEVMHQTITCVAVHDGLVIAPDNGGYIHCLDAKTGKKYWTHDAKEPQYGDALVVDGKVYVSNQDGGVIVLELLKTRKFLAKVEQDQPIVAPLVYANGTLYVLTEQTLYAIAAPRK